MGWRGKGRSGREERRVESDVRVPSLVGVEVRVRLGVADLLHALQYLDVSNGRSKWERARTDVDLLLRPTIQGHTFHLGDVPASAGDQRVLQ